ncbi:HAMP domain-containing sensor histidine kinase [Microlunatus ginsengisoli]|uniref:histidine kinase n=1 Tax=Microlunatus ginsengisoli TaxID=363863 RepID=A0ABP6ZKG8_9ACTN
MSRRSRAGVARDDRELLGRAAWRLGLQIGLLFLACLLVVAGIVVFTVVRSQQAQTVSLLDDAIAASHGTGGRPDHDRDDRPDLGSVRVAIVDPGGIRTSTGMPAGLPDRGIMAAVRATGGIDQRTVTVSGRRYAVRTAQHGDDTVQAVLDVGEQRGELFRLLRAIALAGGIGLVIAVAGSAWLARRAVRPMAEALALQRRFVADASHELRTPLTLLSTRAQLMARRLRRTPDDSTRASLEQDAAGLVADAANLTSVLEDLLAAADTRTSADLGPVELTAVVREAAEAAKAFAASSGIEIVTAGGELVGLDAANRAALLRAVIALLDNAISHARRTVQVEVFTAGSDAVVEVRDDGAGIAAGVARPCSSASPAAGPRPLRVAATTVWAWLWWPRSQRLTTAPSRPPTRSGSTVRC